MPSATCGPERDASTELAINGRQVAMIVQDDSDYDPTKVQPTPVQWRLFEAEAARIQAGLDPNSTVERDVRLEGTLSRQQRQIDVLGRGTMGGQPFTVAVECKLYAKRLGIGAIGRRTRSLGHSCGPSAFRGPNAGGRHHLGFVTPRVGRDTQDSRSAWLPAPRSSGDRR